MMYTLLLLVAVVLAFFIGRRTGARHHPGSQSLGEAWQRGYEAATEYWRAAGQDAGQQQARATLGVAGSAAYAAPPQTPVRAEAPLPDFSAPPAAPDQTAAAATGQRPADAHPAAAGLPFMPAHSGMPGPIAPTGHAASLSSDRPAAPKPRLSPRERELRNINITLYVAALLLVAAGALFLSFALPPVAKLVGLCAVAAAFYGAGLLVHRAKPALRPAAAAFTGTGLALLPLCGIATYSTLGASGTTIWWVTSLIGTLAFGYATVQLRSRILAWLAVLILVSTAMSSGAALQQGMLAYLLALLGLSVALQLLVVRSRLVRDSLFHQAFRATCRILPPLVFLAALAFAEQLGSREYYWIFLLLSLHYLLATLLVSSRRIWSLAAARALFVLALWAGLVYIQADERVLLTVLAYVLALQAVLVVRFQAQYREGFGATTTWLALERVLLWAAGWSLIASLYAAAWFEGQPSWWVTLLVIPSLLLILLWLVRGPAAVESLAVLAFAVLATAERMEPWWTPLPALVLAVAGLSYVLRRQPEGWARFSAQLRWVLLLLVAMKLAQSLQVLLSGERPRDMLLPSVVGVVLLTAGLLVRNFLRTGFPLAPGLRRSHLLARFAASAVVLAGAAAVLRPYFGFPAGQGSFLGLDFTTWSVVVLLLAAASTWIAGWRSEHFGAAAVVVDPVLRGLLLPAITVFFLLALRSDLWWLAPLVAAGNIAYLLGSLPRVRGTLWLPVNAGLAQLHFTAATWWMVDHFELDRHGQLSVLLLSVVLPQAARLYLARKAQTSRVELRYLAVAMILALPVVLAGYALGSGGADRGTVLLGVVLWIGYAVLAHGALRDVRHRQWLLLPVPLGAVALCIVPALWLNPDTGWLRQPLWGRGVAMCLMAVLGFGVLLVEYLRRHRADHRQLRLVCLAVPLLGMAGFEPTRGWMALVFLLAAVACGLLVHTRRIAALAGAASVLLLISSFTGVRAVQWGQGVLADRTLDFSWSMLGGSLVLLITALLHGCFAEPLPAYPRTLLPTSQAAGQAARLYYAAMLVSALLAGASAHLLHRELLPLIGGAVLVLAVLLVVRLHEIPPAPSHHGTDALFVVAALLALRCYTVLVHAPAASSVLLSLAMAAALVALRHLQRRGLLAERWMIGGAVLASAAEVATLADDTAMVQMLVLVFFAGLLALGLVTGKKLFTWWAALTITAAVIWFLRNYAFVLLTLLALALIVLAVLKLVKVEGRQKS